MNDASSDTVFADADTLARLFTEDEEETAVLIGHVAPDAQARIDAVMFDALRGRRSAVRSYLDCYLQITKALSVAARSMEPDLNVRQDETAFLVVEMKSQVVPGAASKFRRAACDVPFSWASKEYGHGKGAALLILEVLRSLVGSWPPLRLSHFSELSFPSAVTDASLRLFDKHIAEAMDNRRPELERIGDTFHLSKTALGGLFGVSRQAIDQWLDKGVPAERVEKVSTVASTVDLLGHHLKTERIAGIARVQADAYDGLTMLEMIERDRHRELLELVRDSFDWARTA